MTYGVGGNVSGRSPRIGGHFGSFDKQEVLNTRGYDRNIFTEGELREKLEYCHKNPITRGLVGDAADWKWSSYRFYEFDDRSVLPMDWDGCWPID